MTRKKTGGQSDNATGSVSDQNETTANTVDDLKKLSASRRGKLGACTRRMNEIKALLNDPQNVYGVTQGFENFKVALNEFKACHEAVQKLLIPEIQENETIDWYEPKMEIFNGFMEEVELWIMNPNTDDLVEPHDSASNLSFKSKGSSKSGRSKSSSASRERLRIATEKAATEARMAVLTQKHAMELEKAKLNAKLEKMELEADMAASDAKLRVLDSLENVISLTESKHVSSPKNSQYNASLGISESSPAEYAPIGAIPKTPLQHFTSHKSKVLHNATNKSTSQCPAMSQSENQSDSESDTSTSTDRSDSSLSKELVTFIQKQNDITHLLHNSSSPHFPLDKYLCLMAILCNSKHS